MTTPEAELANQSPPYEDIDLFGSDRPLRDAVTSNAGGADHEALTAFGRRWGAAAMFGRGRLANAHTPQLETLDDSGFRCDTVEFHPAYHALMGESVAEGLAASTWIPEATPAPAPAQVLRAARFYIAAQVETGVRRVRRHPQGELSHVGVYVREPARGAGGALDTHDGTRAAREGALEHEVVVGQDHGADD